MATSTTATGINYKFNTWRLSGEQAEAWSNKAYDLLRYNADSDMFSGFMIGKVLYLHHERGMNAKQIKQQVGQIPTNTIKSITRGFNRANYESKMAYITAMEMLQDEHERAVLERMYNNM